MEVKIKKKLFSEREIQKRVSELGKEITEDYKGKELLVLCILKGSIIFTADLVRKIKTPLTVEYISAKNSKHNSLPDYIKDRDILIVEDIIDSGKTLSYLVDYLLLKGAKSVKTATMLDKPSRRVVDFTPDYCGREIPDEFVVGYGLDYDEKYRALPYIGILKPEVYEK